MILILFIMIAEAAVAARDDEWTYHRSMCTGLGDRFGILLSLAAAARAYHTNGTVTFRWCAHPMQHNDSPDLQRAIPGWTGYGYRLSDLHAHFRLPEGLRIVPQWSAADPSAEISDTGSSRIPAVQGLPFLPTLGHEMFAVEGRPCVAPEAFRRAYREAAAQLRPLAEVVPARFDVVVHMRAWDRNTAAVDMQDAHFCTRAVLGALLDANVTSVAVLSHDRKWARRTLGARFRRLLLRQATPWEDMAMLLDGARRGIVQHASEGWSAFSTVPAFARPGVALINTYGGQQQHRFDYWRLFGPIPDGLYRCHETAAFVAHVVAGAVGDQGRG